MKHVLAVGIVAAFALAACEKVDHENIDKWTGTQKGPGKLKKALRDGDLDPDLSAHAGINLIKLNSAGDVVAALGAMDKTRAGRVLEKLAPRLWEMARVEGEFTPPSPAQFTAKDVMYELRTFADPATRDVLDTYLADWYTSGYYEGRATVGKHLGTVILRELGPKAGKKMIAAANALAAKPAKPNGQRYLLQSQLLTGLAVTGDPEAVGYVLDLVSADRGDPALPDRAMGALATAYIDPGGAFPTVPIASVKPHVQTLINLAQAPDQRAGVVDVSVRLIAEVGMPDCLPPLLSMVSFPARSQRFRYVGANNALRCGGAASIVDVVRALPADGYDHAELGGAVWSTIVKMGARPEVLAALRTLAQDKAVVSRWVAIEALAGLKSAADTALVRGLQGDRAPLRGYWGADSTKPVPTLGARAKELAATMP